MRSNSPYYQGTEINDLSSNKPTNYSTTKRKIFNQQYIKPTCENVIQINGYNINTASLLHTLVFSMGK